ncbi:MAG TPA: heme-binding protein [Steroidobacteraceae bacterium]|nr:heme-binding protein [Steroidobacteraceae bacterium]
MSSISLNDASRIIDSGLERARELRFKPLTIAVLDVGGHLVAMKREDNSGILRPEIAQAKAWSALGMGAGSRALAKRAEHAPGFYAALASTSLGRMIPVPGGVLIRNASNEVIGAVGVSGDLPDNDEACAVHGIEQTGLTADTGAE